MPIVKKTTLSGVSLVLVMTLSQAIANHHDGHVDVAVGDLSERGIKGQRAFNQNCAICHGLNGEGTKSGPPLVHEIYNPGHHSNSSFNRAVRQGVQQHHWPYGDMPPQEHISFIEMIDIVAFIREVQEQNGIVYRKHQM